MLGPAHLKYRTEQVEWVRLNAALLIGGSPHSLALSAQYPRASPTTTFRAHESRLPPMVDARIQATVYLTDTKKSPLLQRSSGWTLFRYPGSVQGPDLQCQYHRQCWFKRLSESRCLGKPPCRKSKGDKVQGCLADGKHLARRSWAIVLAVGKPQGQRIFCPCRQLFALCRFRRKVRGADQPAIFDVHKDISSRILARRSGGG